MRKALLGLVTGALVLSGCGGGDREDMATPGKTLPAPGQVPPAVRVGGTARGVALVDAFGMALYLFAQDGRDRATCRGDCAAMWPPYLAEERPRAGEGARDDLIGRVRRPDGRHQVTYAGHPLYRYVRDRSPAQAEGHDLWDHGAEWYLVTADGRRLRP